MVISSDLSCSVNLPFSFPSPQACRRTIRSTWIINLPPTRHSCLNVLNVAIRRFIYRGLDSFHGEIIKIIVVSDVHLGSGTCDRASFNSFLGSLHEDPELNELVLLGDIVDMWRRDASGVFLENMETMQIIKDLQNKIKVHWVAGNHDYHVLRLKNRAPHYRYPFDFKKDLEIVDGGRTIRFMHGSEFEYGHELGLLRPSMEILCRLMSDFDGVEEERLWTYLQRKFLDLHYTIFTQHLETRLKRSTRSLNDSPQERLKENKLERVEKRAYEEVRGKPNHLLVFGHTHHPFISNGEELVNTGSWVTDSPVHKTYVVLQGGIPHLLVYDGKEITERQEFV
jgi:UDP-2,3-diacylglucosamine pyrophosphatase LpxH